LPGVEVSPTIGAVRTLPVGVATAIPEMPAIEADIMTTANNGFLNEIDILFVLREQTMAEGFRHFIISIYG
jgi:hypothetical protein